jgi:phosphomannomutase
MELFGTAGVRGPVCDRVTPELVLAVGRAAGLDADGETFVVGRDGRETGAALTAAMTAGLESAGADVRVAGRVPTPALAHASRGRRGVMLTASHNPPLDNGIKLFVDGVEYDRTAERRVEERVETDDGPVAWDDFGEDEPVEVLTDYRADVVDYARRTGGDRGDEPLAEVGLRVAVDCGNGMASVATPQVVRALGAEVVAFNANVDGHFPARESKPTPESLVGFRRFLADADDPFDLGLAHDGDADRLVVLDGSGEVVHEDTVLAILAEHYVRAADAGDPVVVTTPNASARIDERVTDAGGRVERIRLGALHEGIAEARAAGDADTVVAFAGEPWKHVHPGFGGWIDGVVGAAVVAGLVAAEGGLDALREPVTERPYRKENVDCPNAKKATAMDLVAERLPDHVPGRVDTEYGVRVDRPDGSWVLVRPSGTEPYLRVYAESDSVDDLVGTAVETVTEAVTEANR